MKPNPKANVGTTEHPSWRAILMNPYLFFRNSLKMKINNRGRYSINNGFIYIYTHFLLGLWFSENISHQLVAGSIPASNKIIFAKNTRTINNSEFIQQCENYSERHVSTGQNTECSKSINQTINGKMHEKQLTN